MMAGLAQLVGSIAVKDGPATAADGRSGKSADDSPCDGPSRRSRLGRLPTIHSAVSAARALHATGLPPGPSAHEARLVTVSGLDPVGAEPEVHAASDAAVKASTRRVPSAAGSAHPPTPEASRARVALGAAERAGLIEPSFSCADYKVPTFTDAQGWAWMLPMCVSRYVLLASIAQRTETANQQGGAFEAHAMGMLYNSVVHLWHRGEDLLMHAQTVGPKSVAAHEQTHPAQHILYVDHRWVHFDPERETMHPVPSSPADSLFATLLRGYTGQSPTTAQIATCRKDLAAVMRAPSNRESFAAQALSEVQQRFDAFVAADPPRAQRLHDEMRAFSPAPPPTFMWDGEVWPHPACAAVGYLLRNLMRPIRQMGAWGSELEAEIAAHARQWRVHMWKPREEDGPSFCSRGKPQYEHVVAYGPQNGRPVHVVNIIDNKHFAQFVPESDAWQNISTQMLRLGGHVTDCGAGGNCLYFSMLGPGSSEADVASLRNAMLRYVLARPQTYQAIASDAVDIRWNDFLASCPRQAAQVAKRADLYCARQLEANHPA